MSAYIRNSDFYQTQDWMHRSFCCPGVPARSEDFHRISGNARFHADAGNESDHRLPDLLQAWECYRKSYGLFVLGRPCKYNIYKNIEGKADIPPFQCINSDVQKWASIFLPQNQKGCDTTKKSPLPERSPPASRPEPETNHQTQHSERTGTSIWN